MNIAKTLTVMFSFTTQNRLWAQIKTASLAGFQEIRMAELCAKFWNIMRSTSDDYMHGLFANCVRLFELCI